MSDPVRITLTGKNEEQWSKLFDKLTDIVTSAVSKVTPEDVEDESVREYVAAISDISKSWASAKIERPTLENEKLIAETLNLFEDLKLKREQNRKLKLENDSLELDLLEKRLAMALRMLNFLHNKFVRNESGELTLLLTNQEPSLLFADIKAITSEAGAEDASK